MLTALLDGALTVQGVVIADRDGKLTAWFRPSHHETGMADLGGCNSVYADKEGMASPETNLHEGV